MTTKSPEKKTRYRDKVDYRTISRDAYNNFLETNEIEISKELWTKVINEYNSGLVDYLIQSGEKISLLHGLGDFEIRKKRVVPEWIVIDGIKMMKNAPIDWNATRNAGKVIRTQNYHTDFFTCTYVWKRGTARFLNSNCWIFKFCRLAKRGLAAHLKSDNARYSLDRYAEIIKY